MRPTCAPPRASARDIKGAARDRARLSKRGAPRPPRPDPVDCGHGGHRAGRRERGGGVPRGEGPTPKPGERRVGGAGCADTGSDVADRRDNLGVDYSAPLATPFRAVADGKSGETAPGLRPGLWSGRDVATRRRTPRSTPTRTGYAWPRARRCTVATCRAGRQHGPRGGREARRHFELRYNNTPQDPTGAALPVRRPARHGGPCRRGRAPRFRGRARSRAPPAQATAPTRRSTCSRAS